MKNRFKKTALRIWVAAIAFAMLSTCLFLFPEETKAGVGALTVKARYFGYPEVTKAVIGEGELYGIGGGYGATYTTSTNGAGAGFLSYGQGQGATLYDVLVYSGIDPGTVSRFNFTAEDGHNAGYEYMAGTLLWSSRFYFPELSKYFERNTGISDPEGVMPQEEIINDILWASAERVETMIAASEGFGRVDDYSEFTGWDMSSDKAFRLMFGQTSPGESNASDFIYLINTIIVTYEGYPEIIAGDVEFKIGENRQLEISVNSAESEISQAVMSGLKYVSNDPDIVTVDPSGKLTAHKEGTASITISYDNQEPGMAPVHQEKTVNISVGGKETGDGGTGGPGSGTGDGQGSGTGNTGNGNEPGSSTGSGEPGKDNGTGKDNKTDNKTDRKPAKSETAGNVKTKKDNKEETVNYTVSSSDNTNDIKVNGKTIKVRKLVSNKDTGGDGQQEGAAGASGAAAGGSAPLSLSLNRNIAGMAAGGAGILLFIIGAVLSYIRYRKEF